MSNRVSCYFLVTAFLFYLLTTSLTAQESQSLATFYRSTSHGALRFIEEEDSLVADGSALQQIILLRHGQPQISKKGWINRIEAINYAIAYDTVGVMPFDKRPFTGSSELHTVFTSELPRSMHSAYLLFGDDIEYRHLARFNEFERKIFKFANLKMPLGFWSGMSRILWLMGFNDRGIESYRAARYRAFYNALFLEDEVDRSSRALLVAHGFMNRYIAKHLKRRGWNMVNIKGKEYWGAYVLYRYR